MLKVHKKKGTVRWFCFLLNFMLLPVLGEFSQGRLRIPSCRPFPLVGSPLPRPSTGLQPATGVAIFSAAGVPGGNMPVALG